MENWYAWLVYSSDTSPKRVQGDTESDLKRLILEPGVRQVLIFAGYDNQPSQTLSWLDNKIYNVFCWSNAVIMWDSLEEFTDAV